MTSEGHEVAKPTTLEEYLEIQLKELDKYLEGAKIGDPRFLALCDRIEFNRANFDISNKQERLREARERGDKSTICEETDLRLAEERFHQISSLKYQRQTQIEGYAAHFQWFRIWEGDLNDAVLWRYTGQKLPKSQTGHLEEARDNILYRPTVISTAPRPSTAPSPTLISSPSK